MCKGCVDALIFDATPLQVAGKVPGVGFTEVVGGNDVAANEAGGTIYHENVEGQANPNFAHRADWAPYCSFCAAEIISDWRGTPLRVGSTVVWAYITSLDVAMSEGTVLELLPHATESSSPDYCGRCASAATCRGFSLRVLPSRGTTTRVGEVREPTPVKLTAVGRVTVVD